MLFDVVESQCRAGELRKIAGLGRHVSVNDVRIHYLDFPGHGAPIVVLPGITSPAISWSFVASRLAQTNRVIVLDHRGRGLSQSGSDLSYRLDDYAADTAGVMESLGLQRPIILGHSMGARIGLRLATRSDVAIEKLIAVDPPMTGPGRKKYPVSVDAYLREHELVARGAMTLEMMRERCPKWTDEQLECRLQWLPTCCVSAIRASHAGFEAEDIFQYFPLIRCPTLLLAAADSDLVSNADASEAMSLLPRMQIEHVSGGHMLPFENLEGFMKAVVAFLER